MYYIKKHIIVIKEKTKNKCHVKIDLITVEIMIYYN